jgi:DNA-directed RNA polymerase subunit F
MLCIYLMLTRRVSKWYKSLVLSGEMTTKFYIFLLVASVCFANAFAQTDRGDSSFDWTRGNVSDARHLSKAELERLHEAENGSDSIFSNFSGVEKAAIGGSGTVVTALAAVIYNVDHVIKKQLVRLTYTERFCLNQPSKCMEMIEELKSGRYSMFDYEQIIQQELKGINELAETMGFRFYSEGDIHHKKLVMRFVDSSRIKTAIQLEPLVEFEGVFKAEMATARFDFENGIRFLREFSNVPKKKLSLAITELLKLYKESTSAHLAKLIDVQRKLGVLEKKTLPLSPTDQLAKDRHLRDAHSAYDSIRGINKQVFNHAIVSHDRNINFSRYRLDLKGFLVRHGIVRWYRNTTRLAPKSFPTNRLKVAHARLGMLSLIAGLAYVGYEYLDDPTPQPQDEIAMATHADALLSAVESGDWEAVDIELGYLPDVCEGIHEYYQEYMKYKRLMN